MPPVVPDAEDAPAGAEADEDEAAPLEDEPPPPPRPLVLPLPPRELEPVPDDDFDAEEVEADDEDLVPAEAPADGVEAAVEDAEERLPLVVDEPVGVEDAPPPNLLVPLCRPRAARRARRRNPTRSDPNPSRREMRVQVRPDPNPSGTRRHDVKRCRRTTQVQVRCNAMRHPPMYVFTDCFVQFGRVHGKFSRFDVYRARDNPTRPRRAPRDAMQIPPTVTRIWAVPRSWTN